ncbi:MAG: HAD hydrolase family protein [Candidatus Polarisedimenticolia bacterium]
MRYHVLACDYDGTLAHDSRVADHTVAALERVKDSGRRLVLVTGRILDELIGLFPQVDLFDAVVAENGALVYDPSTRESILLGSPPPAIFIETLRRAGAAPIAVGRSIVATWEPHETVVLQAIRDLGLELHLIFNKGAVMVLPSGINKATGLVAALDRMKLSPHNAVGVGDAENDHAFLEVCEVAVAVSNALPILKEKADLVTQGDHGDGVAELCEQLLADDLASIAPRLTRHEILLGHAGDGAEVRVPPYGVSILLAGTSGGGKSTIATSFLERVGRKKYQYVITDPEGDYQDFEGAIVLGGPRTPVSVEEVLQVLENPMDNAVANMLGIALPHRPAFFEALISTLLELRARAGRPHWLVIDETHHMIPAERGPAPNALPQRLGGTLMITVHPDKISPAALTMIDLVLAIGSEPGSTLAMFAKAVGKRAPRVPKDPLKPGEAIGWWWRRGSSPFWMKSVPARMERKRHHRKYMEGELPPDRSFFFRGRDGRLKLRAQNLQVFSQLAEGVDDETWLHHLQHGDYSAWFRDGIKDDDLAEAARIVEQDASLPADVSRGRILARIQERYTGAA